MTVYSDNQIPVGGLFEEERSADIVNARISDQANPRLREVMAVLTRHLHAAIKEIEPSHDEWLRAIEFLTRTGQMCTDWRQEYILLSDVLGATMLVDAINHRRPKGATPNTILGPFYVADAPRYENGANICLDGKGEPTLSAVGCLIPKAIRLPGQPWISGKPTTTASMTCSKKAYSQITTCAACSPLTSMASTPFARSSHGITRSRPMARWASCWASWGVIPTAPRTCTLSSRRRASIRLSPISSPPIARTCMKTRYLA